MVMHGKEIIHYGVRSYFLNKSGRKKGDVENQNSEKQTSQSDQNSSIAPDNYLESSEKLLESLDKLESSRQQKSTYLASLFTSAAKL